MEKIRTVAKKIDSLLTSDGAGVVLRRSIGTEALPELDPFLLLDAFGTENPGDYIAGFPDHPHRGFETVTYMLAGSMRHRDSNGDEGVLLPGGVQWMTAGRGIIHEEFHSRDFSKIGGQFEMVQLWVNLPKNIKMIKPSYQAIIKESIPIIKVQNNVTMRVIAGKYNNIKGPANTHTEINIYDIYSEQKENINIKLSDDSNTIVLIMRGRLSIKGIDYQEKSIVVLERENNLLNFHSSNNFKALILNGKPIEEPLVAHGPFVMNNEQEILTAIEDYQNGSMENNSL